jgi:DNA-binding GntR family transcriptional regulator
MNSMPKDVKPLRNVVYEKLVADIVTRKINPGEKLLESDLTKRFRVSRTPVREALFQLEKDGYISHKKNVGAVVNKISAGIVSDYLDVVAQLEGYATEQTIKNNIQAKDILNLKKILSQMEEASGRREYKQYGKLNIKFHDSFLKKCGNQVLRQIVLDLRMRLFSMVPEGATLPLYIDLYLDSHRNIIRAASAGDARQAGNLMRKHITESKERIIYLFQ